VVAETETAFGDAEYAEQVRTYRYFVKGTVLFAAYALVLLLLLYYFVA
jgi:hypothetical protein